jgi:hypothetical protein
VFYYWVFKMLQENLSRDARNVGAQGNRCFGLAATITVLTVMFIRYCAKMVWR